ncbi:DUF5916 domain-containing protein [Sanyastnella coralliicola]|uniref:DUF5916 domain-containing protein n=1 Tax=Sanyastnella coralliicola TaxID=3069118 RepID=UPI0027BA1DC8|nr:DUF5916 domain-containing protein [Longitalea sp. SCSIO 12813]
MPRLFAVICIFFSIQAFAGGPTTKKALTAFRLEESIKVDGLLDEPVWENAEIATGFIQNRPNPGDPASAKSEVRILYDDESIYVGAYMYDNPDSILSQLTERDDLGNTDFFGFWISTFQDGINAFEFIVTPDGVQFDAQISAFGEDSNWNAVWQCNTQKVADGWIAEFKIPYSAIRFPDKENQSWDINFFRRIRRLREQSFWQFVDPTVAGTANQSGVLNDLQNIKPPIRLFFYPYAIGYAEVNRNADGETEVGTRLNGGMDVKYGISDAFTLDMTLIPDFGQARSDNRVLNLSPFEVFFAEQRQFFTEGTELFNKGGLFYSRRVGGFPINFGRVYDEQRETEEIVDLPIETRLLNATKISGRTPSGLGLGVFNAVAAETNATLRDTETGEEREVEISPLTNYSVLVADQNLGNNSYATIINTNVMRAGDTYDANVTAVEFDIRDKNNAVSFTGGGAYSKKFNFDENTDDGYRYSLGVSKISGNFNFGADHSIMTKHYDHNDLGFLTNANEVWGGAWASYNIYEPFWWFNRMWSSLYLNYSHLHQPNAFTGASAYADVGFSTKSFDAFGLEFSYDPVGNVDYFEPRTDGWFFNRPENYFFGGWISSDYRRKVALDIGTWNTRRPNMDWYNFNWRVSPRYRVSDKLQFIYVYSHQNAINEQGFTDIADNGDIIFGQRDVVTRTNVLTMNYIFTNRMGLSFRLRHYWRTVAYDSFMQLGRDGDLHGDIVEWDATSENPQGIQDIGTTRDLSYNAFNIDMIYTWVFSPGSELRIVWKNQIEDADQFIPSSFESNVDRLFELPQGNSISIRLLYFIDYLNFTRKGKFIEN